MPKWVYESEVRNRSHLKVRFKMGFKAMRLDYVIEMAAVR